LPPFCVVAVSVVSGADALAITLFLIAIEGSFSSITPLLTQGTQQIIQVLAANFPNVGIVIASWHACGVSYLLVAIRRIVLGRVVNLALHLARIRRQLEHAPYMPLLAVLLVMLNRCVLLDDNRSTLWFNAWSGNCSVWPVRGAAAIAAIIVSGLAILRLTDPRENLLRAC